MQGTQETERVKGRGKRKQEDKKGGGGGGRKSDSERKTKRRQEKVKEGSFVLVNRTRKAPDLGEGGKYLSPSIWSIFTFEGLGNTGD